MTSPRTDSSAVTIPWFKRSQGGTPYVVPFEAIEWDVPTWRRAFLHWEKAVARTSPTPTKALELGSFRGGASLFLADRFGIPMTCTDYIGVHADAEPMHQRFGVRELMTYEVADATKVPFADASFDLVVFKSILGSIGGAVSLEAMGMAVSEMARVLRPGGMLLFAENLAATPAHSFLRTKIRPWAYAWHYLKLEELNGHLTKNFSKVTLETTGFGCVAVPEKWPTLRNSMAKVDGVLDHVLPKSFRYLAYGHAIK
jgi:ubiquinone/menaquinone biosynthesis C-methylase UbiE